MIQILPVPAERLPAFCREKGLQSPAPLRGYTACHLLIGIIDRLVPSVENPHEARPVEQMEHRPGDARDRKSVV